MEILKRQKQEAKSGTKITCKTMLPMCLALWWSIFENNSLVSAKMSCRWDIYEYVYVQLCDNVYSYVHVYVCAHESEYMYTIGLSCDHWAKHRAGILVVCRTLSTVSSKTAGMLKAVERCWTSQSFVESIPWPLSIEGSTSQIRILLGMNTSCEWTESIFLVS